ncbi:cyclic pyranopterin monophosphate synthase MoaC [Mucilaginibacter terrenus]|uniref:cyclic pyranopterin monophosphate synthase n=1 Tax=Mucilaginibacter terrenus TaxID=2482727 RepID=A0A3E2NVJ1_9SPHI|nr:cyclic pyranopterin monophosphate synthase MoaC [Mucilaginibacter terrenus]RFZ84989.1 cyclic pyranopterin monophosphate synthase MoaC [Mucilaginibacter terrenus]
MLSHIDDQNNPSMVDVSAKQPTHRTATAQSIVVLPDAVMQLIEGEELQSKKGPVFQTAIIAGIMAAKKTGDLIPLCHPLGMENCSISIKLHADNQVIIECTASITAKTGVEMEALVGASLAALTIYDMCKAMSHDIIIKETKLISKTGGKRDFNRA